MQRPSVLHFGAAKRVLRYVAGTVKYEIWYEKLIKSSLELMQIVFGRALWMIKKCVSKRIFSWIRSNLLELKEIRSNSLVNMWSWVHSSKFCCLSSGLIKKSSCWIESIAEWSYRNFVRQQICYTPYKKSSLSQQNKTYHSQVSLCQRVNHTKRGWSQTLQHKLTTGGYSQGWNYPSSAPELSHLYCYKLCFVITALQLNQKIFGFNYPNFLTFNSGMKGKNKK